MTGFALCCEELGLAVVGFHLRCDGFCCSSVGVSCVAFVVFRICFCRPGFFVFLRRFFCLFRYRFCSVVDGFLGSLVVDG